MNQIHLEVQNLTKSYKGIHALNNVSIDFKPGEVHALLGENGAGKSTLCNILSGSIAPDSGNIIINNKVFTSLTPPEAKEKGIGMIYQEFNLVPEMTVYENIFLGKEIRQGIRIKKQEMIQKTIELFDSMNVHIDPMAKINTLSVAYCQLVEIGKVLMEQVKFMIMDEPTAPLTNAEVETLFRLVKEMRASGVTIIYISHRIEELFELSDRITVLRDGEKVNTLNTCETNKDELISLMVGRELGTEFPEKKQPSRDGEVLLEVQDLTTPLLNHISFEVRRGEILGLGGLVGAGRSEVVRAIFGADQISGGQIRIHGQEVKISAPRKAIEYGIGLIPEDRKNQGLHLMLPIRFNVSLIEIRRLCRPKFTISRKSENELLQSFIQKLSIKLGSVENPVSSLSGGNQQKIVLAKWLSTNADILFFDEPTRGIDVGAKKEIYELLDFLRQEGKGIVMISSEMPELIGMCNRVIVLHEGNQQGTLIGTQINQENIMRLASGGTN